MVFLKMCSAFLLTAVVVNGKPTKEYPLTKGCIDCLCEAQSHCNMTKVCVKDLYCGPFRLPSAFWFDSERPTPKGVDPNSKEAFESCMFDFDCSVTSVRNYIELHAQDCNGDRKINCFDYASIMRLGGSNCIALLDEAFKSRIEDCIAERKIQ